MTYFIYTLSEPNTTTVRYVGLTGDPTTRLAAHLSGHKVLKKSHRRHWLNKLKVNGLVPTMRVVGIARDAVEASALECYWIRFYKERGYSLVNYTKGGGNPVYWDAAARERHSSLRKGNSYFSILNKQRIGQPLKPETVEKLRLQRVGRKLNIPPETRKRQGQLLLKRMENPGFRAKMAIARVKSEPLRLLKVKEAGLRRRGTTLSEEHKRKVSEGVRRSQTPEYCRKMSELKKGKVVTIMTPEIKAKISKTLTGVKLSEATKKKIAAATKKKWEDPVYRQKVIERSKKAINRNTRLRPMETLVIEAAKKWLESRTVYSDNLYEARLVDAILALEMIEDQVQVA